MSLQSASTRAINWQSSKTPEDRRAKMAFLFCRQTVETQNQIHARRFADYYGIVEDPATGSTNSCLAAYLVTHRYFGTDQIDARAKQGHKIGRPSRLDLRAHEDSQRINFQVGGCVFALAKGRRCRELQLQLRALSPLHRRMPRSCNRQWDRESEALQGQLRRQDSERRSVVRL